MIYLDNAATTFPKPPAVLTAVRYAMEHCGNPGRSGHAMSMEGGAILLHCREALAEYFHIDDPLKFVFGLNCTDALNTAIHGMVQTGGHVLCSALEHNSVLRPLATLQQKGTISFQAIEPGPDGRVTPEAYEAAMTPETCLVIVTHASNVTGAVQPVAEIAAVCRKHRIPCLVDGAQAAGLVPVDLKTMGADLYAMPGHKGLLGPQGSGVLYVGEGCWPRPLRQGGTGSVSSQLLQPMDMPDYYESGTPPLPAIAGLMAGMEFLLKYGNNLRAAEEDLHETLLHELCRFEEVELYSPLGGPRVGVVSFNVRDVDSVVVADYLEEHGQIACRAGLHCAPFTHRSLGTLQRGAVRLSIGPFNTRREIKKACQLVQQFLLQ